MIVEPTPVALTTIVPWVKQLGCVILGADNTGTGVVRMPSILEKVDGQTPLLSTARYIEFWFGVADNVVVVLLILVTEAKLLLEVCQPKMLPIEPLSVKVICVPKQILKALLVTDPPIAAGLTVIVAGNEFTFVHPAKPITALNCVVTERLPNA